MKPKQRREHPLPSVCPFGSKNRKTSNFIYTTEKGFSLVNKADVVSHTKVTSVYGSELTKGLYIKHQNYEVVF